MTEKKGETLALVLSGGGSKGALQAGFYRAMCESGIRPDVVVGSSVGALNGAFIAAGVGPRRLARGWATLSRGDLFGWNLRLLWKGFAVSSLFTDRRFREFLSDRLPVGRFEELETPLHVVTTHLSQGAACRWDRGDLVEAVLASCSVPGLLPPVYAHGVPHVDGSLGDNFPVAVARDLGADRILAMNCKTCDRCQPAAVSLTEVIGRAFSIAADCTLRRMSANFDASEDVFVLQPEIGEHIYALDFSQGKRLVEAGYEYALPKLREWQRRLEEEPAPAG